MEDIIWKFTSSDVADIPELTEQYLINLFIGTYQLQQAISYLTEMMAEDNEIKV